MSITGPRCHAVRDRGLFLRDCLPHEAISAAHQSVLQEDPASQRPLPSTIFPDKHHLDLINGNATRSFKKRILTLKNLHHDAVAFNSIVSMGDRFLCTECVQKGEKRNIYLPRQRAFAFCVESTTSRDYWLLFFFFTFIIIFFYSLMISIGEK